MWWMYVGILLRGVRGYCGEGVGKESGIVDLVDDEEESECEMHSLDTFGGKECKEGGLEPERCPTPLRDSVPGRQTSDSKLAIELEEHETSIDNSLATYHKEHAMRQEQDRLEE